MTTDHTNNDNKRDQYGHLLTLHLGVKMVYHVVYDSHGEMFEVPSFKLRYLVVELGWTVWHPSKPKKVFEN